MFTVLLGAWRVKGVRAEANLKSRGKSFSLLSRVALTEQPFNDNPYHNGRQSQLRLGSLNFQCGKRWDLSPKQELTVMTQWHSANSSNRRHNPPNIQLHKWA